MKFNRVILSSSIGNALEWYEYLLYAHFADIISNIFFPSENTYTSLMMTFAVFAVGFLARPIGGMVFGYIGDEYGRKTSLTISIAMIAIPTTVIGLLPSYNTIGICAPITLIIMRILQGMSLGGEFSASAIFLVESAPENKKGLFGSFSTSSIAMGILFSSLVIFLIKHFLTQEQVYSYGWRIPFLFSFVIGFVGLYIRKKLPESHTFIKEKKSHHLSKTPFKDIIRYHTSTLIACCAVFMTVTIPFYTINVFAKTVMTLMLGYTNTIVTAVHVVITIVFMVSAILFGYISDKLDGKKILLVSTILMALFIYPFIWSLNSKDIILVFVMSVIAGILIGSFQGVFPTLIVQSFPVNVRSCGVGLSYSIPAALFGGTAPMILTFLVKNCNSIFGIVYYVLFGCILTIAGLLYLIYKKKA